MMTEAAYLVIALLDSVDLHFLSPQLSDIDSQTLYFLSGQPSCQDNLIRKQVDFQKVLSNLNAFQLYPKQCGNQLFQQIRIIRRSASKTFSAAMAYSN